MPSSNCWSRFCIWLKKYANIGVAIGTLALASAAFWQIRHARTAAEAAQKSAEAAETAANEAKEMRFADNRPALLMLPAEEEAYFARVHNYGKGPAIVKDLLLEHNGIQFKVTFAEDIENFLPPGGRDTFARYNWVCLDEFAKYYAKVKGIAGVDNFKTLISTNGKDFENRPLRVGLTYTDVFGEIMYTQYFLYHPANKTFSACECKTFVSKNQGGVP